MLGDLSLLLAGYLLGSIPFAYLLTRLVTGKDVRREHDGNVGARNAGAVAGRAVGVGTLALDIGKGSLAYWAADRFGSGELVVWLMALAVILGHNYPVWLGWEGGKGLAVSCGYLLPIWPLAVLTAALLLLVLQLKLPFEPAYGFTLAIFVVLLLYLGAGRLEVFFVVLMALFSGIKKLFDLSHERELLAAEREGSRAH